MCRKLSIMILGSLLVIGCTTNPYTGEQQTARATTGAAIGAAIGAVAGALTGDDSRERKKRALIGAGVSVTRNGEEIILNMPGHVTFATDSAALNSQFFGVLDSVVKVVTEFDKTVVEVTGHTDNQGAKAYTTSALQKNATGLTAPSSATTPRPDVRRIVVWRLSSCQ